jgi:N-acetylglucosaminyl-diphospho-decaprenol L-rhamnosyltransferase
MPAGVVVAGQADLVRGQEAAVTAEISVIILNYNGRKWLGPCLESLAGQRSAPPFEVLLVDNASTDDSVAFAAKHFPSVRVVRNDRNLGFAAGINAGARTARGAWLAFLNNDTVAAPEWLATLHQSATDPSRGAHFALITSRIESLARPGTIDSAGDAYVRAGGAFKRGHGAAASEYAVSGEVFGACGAAFMIRKDVFDTLGGFDERFFMVYEDVDLSYRARLAGHRCWYAAGAVVRHAGSGTLGVSSPAAIYHGQRNLEWTYFKNTPSRLLLRTLPAHVGYSLAGLAYYVTKGGGGSALRGKIDALLGLATVLRQRRAVQHAGVIETEVLEAMMDREWLARKRREKSTRLDLPDEQNPRVQ